MNRWIKYEEYKKGLVDLTSEEYEEAIRIFCKVNNL